jgi:hypothetical protein
MVVKIIEKNALCESSRHFFSALSCLSGYAYGYAYGYVA